MSAGKDKASKDAKKDKALEKVDEEAEESKRGWVRWTLGWIVTPGAILGGIFTGGAMVGAHTSESWFTQAIVWLVDLF